MSRPPRFSYAHALHHVTLRCNNREFLFAEPSFLLFVDVLQEARALFPLSLYNYCVMTNHIHLLFKVGEDDTLSETMHWIGGSFSRRFNRLRNRHGHLWEGRFRSTIIEENSYFFRCMAYVDLNPVRAAMVPTPLEYRWSGHRSLRDEDRTVLDFHPLYLDGGKDAESRYASYARLLEDESKRPLVALATRHFVGSARFVGRMEQRFGLSDSRSRFVRDKLIADNGTEEVVSISPKLGRARRSK